MRTAVAWASRPFIWFFRLEAASSIVLLAATLAALAWANSADSAGYFSLWQTKMSVKLGGAGLEKPLLLWINDGLMAVFFLLVGLEIKREVVAGELRKPTAAALPLGAAIGGMAFPALIFVAFNAGEPTLRAWGVPMATDIAFALGILALLGPRVPAALRVFLAAAAIVDDLGAVLVIAIFYTAGLELGWLFWAAGAYLVLVLLNRSGVRVLSPYLLVGLVLWFAVLKSGVHATVAGVLVSTTLPSRGAHSPMETLEHTLVPYVAYFIVPLFALANAGVHFGPGALAQLTEPLGIGIILGLLVGKQLGILGVPWVLVRLGLIRLPAGVRWIHLHGVAWLAGIGFTMALFIAGLGLPEASLDAAKSAILVASLAAALIGMAVLYLSGSGKAERPAPAEEPPVV